MLNALWMSLADEHYLADLLAVWPWWALALTLVGSIILLSKGADWMIDGVVQIALRTGIPKIIIGATVLSLGTTMPEAFVSVMAAFMGNPGLSLGNGVGSIIADTGLIFGFTAMVAAVPANKYILRRTGSWQIGSATLLVVIAVVAAVVTQGQPSLGRPVGAGLLILLVVYLVMNYRWARSGHPEMAGEQEELKVQGSLLVDLGLFIGGLLLVIIGSRLLIPAASELARRVGVPEDVIAATLVAFGTSLPELITAVTAIRKKHPEIVLGNVIGADVLNCLFVIGASAFARPLAVPRTFFLFHFPAMLLILWSFRLFGATARGGVFRRWHGGVLLGLYVAYLILQYAWGY